MRIIEIKTLNNGSHKNQSGEFNIIPEGWAVIPDNMETPNFPFGEITTKKIDGVVTVTKWTPNEIPEMPKVEAPVSEIEQLRADIDYIALMKGVDL